MASHFADNAHLPPALRVHYRMVDYYSARSNQWAVRFIICWALLVLSMMPFLFFLPEFSRPLNIATGLAVGVFAPAAWHAEREQRRADRLRSYWDQRAWSMVRDLMIASLMLSSLNRHE